MATDLKRTRTIKKPIAKTIKTKVQESWEDDFLLDTRKEVTASTVNTVPGLIALLESDKTIEIEARVLAVEKHTGKVVPHNLNKKQFIEAYKKNSGLKKFKESIDWFSMDAVPTSGNIGDDYTPLLGGPFNKQLYLYDMLKMHSVAFNSYNHDPILKACIDIKANFTLGRGYRVDCENKAALALWRAFEEANDLQTLIGSFNKEIDIYGEQFIWWLPQGESKIQYKIYPGQEAPKALLPRVRLIDPSTVWEIVTYPEDITRVLYAQLVFPTQYQIYTGSDAGRPVSSTKFIYQQIPAEQFKQYKINCTMNEKRGRSSLFPVLGYAKRLRDSINYSVIGLQKATAWSMDTTIDGNQQDIDAYIQSQLELGTIPQAGSEFVHSTKITRQYMANEGTAKGGNSQAFDWCFSQICMGMKIPMQYLGAHMSGQGTRGNAIVATEPVAKEFEMRQVLIEKVLQDMATKLFKMFGIDAEIEVSFPEIVVQDRSQKMKDLAMAEQLGWISHERAAQIAAKELGITKYDWVTEKQIIDEDKADGDQNAMPTNPLTAPAAEDKSLAISGQDKAQLRKNDGF